MLFPLMVATLLTVQEATPSQTAAPQRSASGRFETDKTITVPKGTRIVLSSEGGVIVVKTWDRDAVRVRASHSSRVQISADLKDQVLMIGADSSRPSSLIDYDLTVPVWIALHLENRYSDIEVEGVSGNVSVESIEGELTLRNLSGPVSAKTIEGAIKLEGGRGKVELNTVEGDISVIKASGDITADTTDGTVTLTDVQASTVSVSTVDGDIHFTGALQATGQYEFTSHDGDIVLTIPENSSATFGVRTVDDENQVHTTFALKAVGQVRRGRRATYTLGAGAAQVEVETFDGSFYLRKPGETIKK